MSAGQFLRGFYTTDSGEVAGIRTQPETAALALTPGGTNVIPAGPATLPTRARVSGGRRRYGIKARTVTIVFTGAVPDGYKPDSPITLPVFTPTVYNAIVPDATGTYLGSSVRVVGKSPETIK